MQPFNSPGTPFVVLRRNARILATIYLYGHHFFSADMAGYELSEKVAQSLSLISRYPELLLPQEDLWIPEDYDKPFLEKLLFMFFKHEATISDTLLPHLDRNFKIIGIIERAILNLAVVQMLASFQLDVKIVINESIELAKCFGAEQSFKFINGVLHSLGALAPLKLDPCPPCSK